jgi:hypothetical protein
MPYLMPIREPLKKLGPAGGKGTHALSGGAAPPRRGDP